MARGRKQTPERIVGALRQIKVGTANEAPADRTYHDPPAGVGEVAIFRVVVVKQPSQNACSMTGFAGAWISWQREELGRMRTQAHSAFTPGCPSVKFHRPRVPIAAGRGPGPTAGETKRISPCSIATGCG